MTTDSHSNEEDDGSKTPDSPNASRIDSQDIKRTTVRYGATDIRYRTVTNVLMEGARAAQRDKMTAKGPKKTSKTANKQKDSCGSKHKGKQGAKPNPEKGRQPGQPPPESASDVTLQDRAATSNSSLILMGGGWYYDNEMESIGIWNYH